ENIRDRLKIGPRCRERFLPLNEPCCRPLADLGVVLGGLSEQRGRYEVERSGLSFHVVLFTLGGRGTLHVGNDEHVLERGDLLIAPAGTSYLYELSAKTWQMLWFHLVMVKSFRAFSPSHCRILRSHLFERLSSAAEALLLEMSGTEPDASRAARFYGELLALNLRRELEPNPDPIKRDYRARFAALWEHVSASLGQAWNVHGLARRFGASPAHFQRLCVEHCALPPGEMLFRLRMVRAEELLRNSPHPLKLIAPMIGYENPFAFSSAFKRHARVSPREYRRSVRPGVA
ncbi:MAG TPA: AraC family transcriptional regulator, partial [Polyangiaceae bacterium]|nr:AraC family transcriptional regulator [Polyangiaceae bacterium]